MNLTKSSDPKDKIVDEMDIKFNCCRPFFGDLLQL